MDPRDARDRRRRGWWRDTTVADDVRAVVEKRPDDVAIVSHRVDSASRAVTFEEVYRSAGKIAASLVDLGVEPGDVVSMQLPNWWEFTAVHLACVMVGAVTNPVL